jgi:hypothetical protein
MVGTESIWVVVILVFVIVGTSGRPMRSGWNIGSRRHVRATTLNGPNY